MPAAKVGINGFGRIGRCLFRLNYELQQGKNFEVTAIKDVMPIKNIAYLLRYDSHYGEFKGQVDIEGNNLIIDNKRIPYYQEQNAANVPWSELGTNILVEASGAISGADLKLLLRGPLANIVYGRNMQGTDATIIYGVNHLKYDPSKHHTISAGSCTGNAIIPIIEIMHSNFGVEQGHLVSIHPVLSEQKVIDVAHPKFNLGRNSMVSIIPVSSGIPSSISVVIPELDGKITALSYRVPTTIVSALDANFRLKQEVTVEQISSLFEENEIKKYKGIIKYDKGYMGSSGVSVDYLKSSYSVIILGLEIQAQGKNILLSMFHDNEWSYSYRFHDLIMHIHKTNQINK